MKIKLLTLLLLTSFFCKAQVCSRVIASQGPASGKPRNIAWITPDTIIGVPYRIYCSSLDSVSLKQFTIIGLSDSLLNRYTKPEADARFKPISYTPTWTDITSKPSFATIATSGDYNDLSNKPTIPAIKRQETYSGTTSGSGTYTVTFSTSYSVAPNIQANIVGGTNTNLIKITSISTTGFTVTVVNRVDVVGLLPSYSNVNGAAVDVLITEK